MRYNYKEQRPDFWKDRPYDAKDIYSLIDDNYPHLHDLFHSVNYNPYVFMYKHLYNSITDENERWEVLCLLLEQSPLREMFYGEFLVSDLEGLNLFSIRDEAKLCYLFFCESEHDFWDYFVIGYGNIEEFSYNYSHEKCRQFLLYLYYQTIEFEEIISSKITTRGISNKERNNRFM